MNKPKPPKYPLRLLQWFCKDQLQESVLGDLEEQFREDVEKYGVRKARRKYAWNTVRFFRPGIIRKVEGQTQLNNHGMLKNYLQVAWRSFIKNKGFSAINIFSLTVGIAACLIIYLFIVDELSFDNFHTKRERIYRLCEVQTWPGTNPQKVPITWPKMGFQLPGYFPEVESYSRYWTWGELLWKTGDKKLMVKNTALADSTFFELFDFELISGKKEEALIEPHSMLITEQVANNFFGTTDVVGQTLRHNDAEYHIKGVLKNIPANSHLQFDVLISLSTVGSWNPDFNSETGSNYIITYVLLYPNADVPDMEMKFPDYLTKLTDDEEINEGYQLFLQQLDEVHLASTDIEHDYQNHRKFNGTYINVFILTGLFILIIASVNFMNLTVARSYSRSKEVGVRKSIGAKRYQLVFQFILESVILSVIALALAFLLALIALPYLNDLISRDLSIMNIFYDLELMLLIVGATFLLGMITGLYPSVYLSSFKITRVLKGAESGGTKSIFRSALVIFQFSLALAMIVCTLVVVQQLFFIKNKDIGFTKDHILLVKMNDEANKAYQVMKEELSSRPNVLGVTASGQRLGNNLHQWGFKVKKDTSIVNITPSNVLVDYNFLDVYDIKLKAGRTFSKEYATDDGLAFVINETFAKELGYEEPIGQSVGHSWYPNDSLGTIIGVSEDFYFNSLHYKVNTLSMVVHSDWGFSEMSIKLNGDNLQAGIKNVEEVWSQHVSDYPFDYQFLDEHFNDVYRSDQQMGSVITIIAILSIFIGCMGLFGLSSISIDRRIKEIGIRKVLGASTRQLLIMLSKNFAILILIAFVLATPVTYFYLTGWLENFAYHIDISPLVFVTGGIIAFLIAMLTISFHTVKATRANPVDSLRDE